MLFFYILWFEKMTLPGRKKFILNHHCYLCTRCLLWFYLIAYTYLIMEHMGKICCVSSGWWLDAVVCVVRLLCELRSGGAGPNPRLHQPPTTQQRVRLQRTSKGNAGVSRCSLPGFVNKCFQGFLSPFQYVLFTLLTLRLFTLNWPLLAVSPTDDLCPWSPWSPCSRSCGAGSVSRRRTCVCEAAGDAACPAEIEAERNGEETQLCYKQPCPGTQWKTAEKHTAQQMVLLDAESVI